ncbi:MAG TPA: MBL fold metallo-hydrolase [Bacteroidales bacterium]|nr:MBL fold metallo-hydrolase [Bacteroidales bacterium]
MRIVTLVENTKLENSTLQERFGLGFYIECGKRKILFDNGPDDAFKHNAEALNINIADVDAYILSHAHYDHGGGLKEFLAINSKAKIYLLCEANGKYYSTPGNAPYKYIGLDHETITENITRFHFFFDNITLFDFVHLYKVERKGGFVPVSNSLLYKNTMGAYEHDDFQHELVLAITENNRNVIFTGCAHSGIINMIETVRLHMPNTPISAVIGGFHLLNTATKQLAERKETVISLAQTLLKRNIPKIYTGHCTGEEGFSILKEQLGDKIEKLYTGSEIRLS